MTQIPDGPLAGVIILGAIRGVLQHKIAPDRFAVIFTAYKFSQIDRVVTAAAADLAFYDDKLRPQIKARTRALCDYFWGKGIVFECRTDYDNPLLRTHRGHDFTSLRYVPEMYLQKVAERRIAKCTPLRSE